MVVVETSFVEEVVVVVFVVEEVEDDSVETGLAWVVDMQQMTMN